MEAASDEDTSPDWFWTDFGEDFVLQIELKGKEKSSKETYDCKIDLEAIWKRSDNDFGSILERLRALI